MLKECKIYLELNFILLQSVSHEDISQWLSLMLEIKKLETEQACLQNEAQKLKDNIQDNSLLNFDLARLTTDIEMIDAQIVRSRYQYISRFARSRCQTRIFFDRTST